jgi:hypothetical protein
MQPRCQPIEEGVGRYLEGLLGALADRRDPDLDFVVVGRSADVARFAALGLDTITGPSWLARRPLRLGWEQTGGLVRRVRAGVLRCPHYTQPLLARVPTVVTLHEATSFTEPGWHSPIKARFFRAATRIAARRATGLIVPSDASWRELAEQVRIPAGHVSVAALGLTERSFIRPQRRTSAGCVNRSALVTHRLLPFRNHRA